MKYVLFCLSCTLFSQAVSATVRATLTGSTPAEIQKRAYQGDWKYPVTEMRCNQRCWQDWEK